MSVIFDHARVVSEQAVHADYAVLVDDRGDIVYVGPAQDQPPLAGTHIDVAGRFLAPGFIDVHVHGGHGVTFGHGDLQAELVKYSNWVATHGVTHFLCSIAAPDQAQLLAMIGEYVRILEQGLPGAQCAGLHLEGPFLSKVKKGAFNPGWLRNPNAREAEECIRAGAGWVKQVTMAPELEDADAVAAIFTRNGIVVALGHSNTDYETAAHALRGEFGHVTHTYNAQSSLNHRSPNVIGAVLTSQGVTAEIISDLAHVHPAAIRLLVDCLGADRVVLITDAMAAAGAQDGAYTLVGQDVTVKNGVALLADGTLAGGTSTLEQCVRNMVHTINVPLVDAIRMASLNPAKVLRATQRLGSIAVGKEASLTVVDEDLNVHLTMVKGKVVFAG
ncbi:MAG: N-acetylglucosamine-6-phosphate deacetylase [Chloroflexi bacterium]|jgi:N-acetylglucosamine-6-phosphate deacetylase|nr:N-acetylglucosamine-6-phosphate deacetylase [Chloroflexota bacterium]